MLRVLQQVLLVALFAITATQASARFLQPDWLDPTNPGVGTNRYAYAANDPINKLDPLGNSWVDRAWDSVFGEDSFKNTFGNDGLAWSDRNFGNIHEQATAVLYESSVMESYDASTGSSRDYDDYKVDQADRVREGIDRATNGTAASGDAIFALIPGAGAYKFISSGANGMARVGRWMSVAEYEAMKSSGRVVASRSGATHVADPASLATFGKQAKSSSVYVEFNVSKSSLQNSGTGVSQVVTPGSIAARRLERAGREVPLSLPKVSNIKIVGTK